MERMHVGSARTGWMRVATAATCVACAIGLIALAPGQREPAPQQAGPLGQSRLPAVQLVGQHSHITEAKFELFRDQDAWAKFWGEHANVEVGYGAISRHAAPKVDFTRFMVVCVLGGKRANTDGITCEGVITTDDLIRVRIEDSTYQTMRGFGEVDHGDSATPYGFFVIEKAATRVVIEQGRRSLKNKPVEWKQVHEFAAP